MLQGFAAVNKRLSSGGVLTGPCAGRNNDVAIMRKMGLKMSC